MSIGGRVSSLAIAVKSRQHAEAVELVIRPMYPRATLICLRLQRAILGRLVPSAGPSARHEGG